MQSIYPLGVSKTRAARYHYRKTAEMTRRKLRHEHGRRTPASSPRRAGQRRRHRSGLRHDGRSQRRQAARPTTRAQTYYFCCNGCRTKFVADPQKYLGKREPEPVVEGAIYTCPMHPQIRQVGPGACPICGMALEPEIATADSGPNPELADMTRRFWIGLVLALPVMVMEMGGHFGRALARAGASAITSNSPSPRPVVLWAGWPFFVRGWQSLVTRNLNMFTLIAHGHRRRLRLQRRSPPSRPAFSRPPSAAHGGAPRSISKPPA